VEENCAGFLTLITIPYPLNKLEEFIDYEKKA
jgi:hypothetical protein